MLEATTLRLSSLGIAYGGLDRSKLCRRPADELKLRSKHQSLDLQRPFVFDEEEESVGSRRVQGKRQNVYGHVREDEESDFPRDDGDGFVPPHLISLPNFRGPLEDKMRPVSVFADVFRLVRNPVSMS